MQKQTEDFLTVNDHFDALVQRLDPETLKVYNRTRHIRTETAYAGRHFIIYEMRGGHPFELTRLMVEDFECDDQEGPSFQVRDVDADTTFDVGCGPAQVPGYPIFLSLPLHLKLRWATSPSNLDGGSLAFPVGVRTLSRINLREPGVIYCETGPTFGREFDNPEGRFALAA